MLIVPDESTYLSCLSCGITVWPTPIMKGPDYWKGIRGLRKPRQARKKT